MIGANVEQSTIMRSLPISGSLEPLWFFEMVLFYHGSSYIFKNFSICSGSPEQIVVAHYQWTQTDTLYVLDPSEHS